MTSVKLYRLPLIFAFTMFVGCQSAEQTTISDGMPTPAVEDQVDVMTPPLDLATDLLPLDPAVVSGRLDNGLQYFIRHNEKPEDRVELRLAIDIGSILEDDDQRGLAHFLEHMAFNGTAKFEKQELVDYLELIGTRFGPDLNAYTSFDETVYMLQVRSDSAEILQTGLEILREWATNITLDSLEIEKERGVVIEEWRLGRGSSARIFDQQIPVLLSGSHYVSRLPIGLPEILRTFPASRLSDFYKQWYRPEFMSVIVVGDVDTAAIEQQIAQLFGDILTSFEVDRPTFEVPDHAETLVVSTADEEAPYSSVSVVYKHDLLPYQTKADYQRTLIEQLFSDMLNNRFDELRQQAVPPFIVAGAGRGSYVRSKDFYNVNAIVQDDSYELALRTLLIEVDRVRQFGFTRTELDRTKAVYLRWYESAFNETDKTESEVYASEYVRHFLEDEAIPGIAFEYDLVKELLPAITLAEVNAEADHWLIEENRVVTQDGPDASTMLDDDLVLSLLNDVKDLALDPYQDKQSDLPLLPSEPVAGSIVSTTVDNEIGITRLELSNGAVVVLKETDFKNDEILFAAYSSGGTSLYGQEMDTPGDFSSTLISQSGVGSHDPVTLEKKISDKLVSITPSIGEMSESISGGAAPQDVETLMQLVHAFMVYPRADSTVYASFMSRIGSLVESFKVDPNRAFYDTLTTTLSQNHPRRRIINSDVLAEMDLEASFQIYKDRFSDAGDFAFYFVGAFEIDSMKPLIETYLASLPSKGETESWNDLGVMPPSGVIKKTVRKGIEPQAKVQLLFSGNSTWSLHERRVVSALANVLDIKLREVLREDLGGTYGVQVGGSISRFPRSTSSFAIGFGCDPERLDELLATVFDELADIKENAPDSTYIDKTREMLLKSHSEGLKKNENWMQWLQFFDRNDLDPALILSGVPDFAKSLSPEMIRDAAARYLDMENYVQVVLLPRETQPTDGS